MDTYLVIDIGTSSVIGMLYSEKLEVINRVQIPTRPTYKGNRVYQDVNVWDNAIIEILKKSVLKLEKRKKILKGVFLTSQRSSLICMGENDTPLTEAIMWEDRNSQKYIEKYMDMNAIIKDKTGSYLNPVYLGSKIIQVQNESPEIFNDTKKFVSIADYIRFKLVGDYVTDYTYASRTSLFNIHTKQWDKDLLDLFSIPVDKLCYLEMPGSEGKMLKKEILNEIGIAYDVPYISSGGDQNCSAVGMGAFKENFMTLTLGTGGFIQYPVKRISSDSELILNVHAIENLYLSEATIISFSSILNYFKDAFYEELDLEDYYSLLSTLASNHKVTDILHYPYYQGRGTPDWNQAATGSYINLSFNSRKEDMLFAIIESLAFEIRENIESFEKTFDKKIDRLTVSGGLSNNKGVLQVISNITKVSLVRPNYAESTARGALIVGLNALNKSTSMDENFKMLSSNEVEEIIEPQNIQHDEKYNEWKRMYRKIFT